MLTHDELADGPLDVITARFFASLRSSPANHWAFLGIVAAVLSANKREINERVIEEMERLLQRPLTPDELRLLLLARIVEEELLNGKAAFPPAA